MVKTQLQAQSHGKFAVGFQHGHSGMINALISAYRHGGIRGLWRGFEGIVPRTAIGSAIQMTTFSKCKDFLSKYEVRRVLFTVQQLNFANTRHFFNLFIIIDIPTVSVFNAISIKHDKWCILISWNDSI